MEHVATSNFTGARGLLAVSYLMTKRGLLPVVVFSLSLFLAGGRASLRLPPPGIGRRIHARPIAGHGRGEQWFGSFATDSIQQLGQSRIRAFRFQIETFFSLATTFNLVGTTPQSFSPFFHPQWNHPGRAVRQHRPMDHPIGYSIYGRTLIM